MKRANQSEAARKQYETNNLKTNQLKQQQNYDQVRKVSEQRLSGSKQIKEREEQNYPLAPRPWLLAPKQLKQLNHYEKERTLEICDSDGHQHPVSYCYRTGSHVMRCTLNIKD